MRDISLAHYFWKCSLAHWNFIRHFEKHEAWRTVKRKNIALGNDTFPNLYSALVYERKFKSEYLGRQIYERLLKRESSIVKLIENRSDLSKLSIYIEWTFCVYSIVEFIENQSEQLSKLTLYHLKKRATRQSRRAREPSRIPLLFLRGLNNKNSMLKQLRYKLHLYVNKGRKLYHARYICNNVRDPKIINLNKMAIPKKAYLLSFLAGIITR